MTTRTSRLGLALLLLPLLAGLGRAQTVHVNLPSTYDLYYVGDLDPRGDMTGLGNEISVDMTGIPSGEWSLSVELRFGDTVVAYGQLERINSPPSTLGPWTLNEIRNNQIGGYTGHGDFNEDFIDEVSGNTLPTGLYVVHAVLSSVPEGSTFTDQGSFFIQDPPRVGRQAPWDGALSFTDQPTFSWSGRARSYRLRVCEFDPELHGSPQEAMEGEVLWEETTPGTSLVYGSGLNAARPLRHGHQYAWLVEAVLSTTSGERAFPSAIRTFRVQSGGGGDTPDLANLLAGLTPGQLAGIGALLEGFHLNGTILVDGRAVSVEEFLSLLQRLAAGELNIASIRIE